MRCSNDQLCWACFGPSAGNSAGCFCDDFASDSHTPKKPPPGRFPNTLGFLTRCTFKHVSASTSARHLRTCLRRVCDTLRSDVNVCLTNTLGLLTHWVSKHVGFLTTCTTVVAVTPLLAVRGTSTSSRGTRRGTKRVTRRCHA